MNAPWIDKPNHAEREIPENEALYRFMIHELKEDVKLREKMISGLQDLIKRQQAMLELHGLDITTPEEE